MPIIFTRPQGGGGAGGSKASEIDNDSFIAGATVKDALEWLDANKVDYNFGSNTISGIGDIYANTYYGDGSNLTGIIIGSSSVINNSSVPGANVTDVLDYLATGSGVINKFVFNQPLTTVSGTQVYLIPHIPVSGTVTVYLNGLLQEPNMDYMITGQIITFLIGIELNDVFLSNYVII